MRSVQPLVALTEDMAGEHPTGSRYRPMSIIEAYRLRWQIELLFKEWKSYANLKRFNTGKLNGGNPETVFGELHTSRLSG